MTRSMYTVDLVPALVQFSANREFTAGEDLAAHEVVYIAYSEKHRGGFAMAVHGTTANAPGSLGVTSHAAKRGETVSVIVAGLTPPATVRP